MTEAGFYSREGLNVACYDALTELPVAQGDVAFWTGLADRAGGPVLELGCGTGRVAWALARAGHEVVGLDTSAPMLARAEARRAAEDGATGRRARFVRADMAGFDLGGMRFGLVFSAFRAFQSLLTPEAQHACLRAAHGHLRPGGLLALDLFDPRLDLCVDGDAPIGFEPMECLHPDTGNRVQAGAVSRRNDALRQTLRERWWFAELDADGRVVREEFEVLALRWTYRQEMRYLLERCGFAVEAEYSDFEGSPPRHGTEQVWVARRP